MNMAAEIGGRDGKGGMVHGVRSLGSATLDLAYCAMGAFVNHSLLALSREITDLLPGHMVGSRLLVLQFLFIHQLLSPLTPRAGNGT